MDQSDPDNHSDQAVLVRLATSKEIVESEGIKFLPETIVGLLAQERLFRLLLALRDSEYDLVVVGIEYIWWQRDREVMSPILQLSHEPVLVCFDNSGMGATQLIDPSSEFGDELLIDSLHPRRNCHVRVLKQPVWQPCEASLIQLQNGSPCGEDTFDTLRVAESWVWFMPAIPAHLVSTV